MKINFENERELFALMESELGTAVICDILDDFRYRRQNMDSVLRPLCEDDIMAGRAKTILAADVYTMPDSPYDTEIEALDSVGQDELIILATNKSTSNAIWGELLSTSAIMNGARGAVVHGCVRDIKKIKGLGFKVFAAGINPLDSKGR